MRHLRGIVAMLVLLAGVPGQVVSTDRVENLLEDHGCPTELPGVADGSTGESHSKRGGRAAPSSSPSDDSASWPGSTGFASLLMWVVVIAAALVLLALIVRNFGGGGERRERGRPVRAVPVPREEEVAGPLPDHARLAAVGDFAGALRALLQRGFAAWAQRAGGLPLHATGREVLRNVQRVAVPSESFASLVQAVERVHFGGREADLALYEDSRARLQDWEEACQRRR
jgi:hypothetical protein